MSYRSPLADHSFILEHVIDYAAITGEGPYSEAAGDVSLAILSEAARLSDEVMAPLQRNGDLHPAVLENGIVRTSPGFSEGFQAIADGGWMGLTASPEHGGLGLPMTVTTIVNDFMGGACLALHLNPLLTQGHIEALEHHASDEIKAIYLPKLAAGEWNGTMNLTEPQAGSDLAALRTKAIPNDDGTHAVSGQKIYISWGDSDIMKNTSHLVLARLPDAPEGVKGISLFVVPKYIPDAEGEPGAANSLRVVSLEHKLGLHGSPTAVMQFDDATGWLVGEPHSGLKAMFTMMNNARLGVGVQGIAIAEAACQKALAYAQERIQGANSEGGKIIGHPDVKRMLAEMRSSVFAARAIAMQCAEAIDRARITGDPHWSARAALLTPIAKSYGTDVGIHVAELGVQVHGGMGFIEETGAAQFSRDVRVTSIYEGTNGIQAIDLVGRKLADNGAAAFALLEDIKACAEKCRAENKALCDRVWSAAESLHEATEWLINRDDFTDRLAGANAYLNAFALVIGAETHLRGYAFGDTSRKRLAQFYIRRLLPAHTAMIEELYDGAECVTALTGEDLAVAYS